MAHPTACLMLLLFSAYTSSRALQATALSFSYDFSKPGDLDRAHLTYVEDSSNSGDRVSLTKETTGSTGRVAYPQPVRLWDKRTGKRASFTTTFSFAINGVASNGTTTTDGNGGRGDGMAFFVGARGLPPDSGGALLGLFSNNTNNPSSSPAGIVGVEFDTFKNSDLDPPDVTADHIGIDINNISSTNYTELPNLALSGTMLANITYDGRSKIMSVSLWVGEGRSRPPYSVKTQVDLREAGVPREATVGFSAATGGLVESHQLLSWSFSSTDPSKTEQVIILIALTSASLAGLVAALLCLVIRRQRRRALPKPKIELTVAREFSYRELSAATKNFSEDRKLGQGSFGEVYRGELRDPRMPPVAVKRLTTLLERTRRDYVTEIMTLGQLSHRNLVKLVGWCDDGGGGGDDKLLLVYELVSNRSLDEHLHRPDVLLPWPERYKIVLGIGSAIEYLHTGNKNPILHRDIKPSNVMLDDDFVAKLGDFGLVRQVQPDQGSLNDTVMAGSWDYMDPMCIITGSASTASDMYSFGVLLLEMATGKRPRVQQDDEKGGFPNILVNAVRESYGKGAVLEMADARLNGDFDENQMERVMLVGLFCVYKNRRNRLGIREAVNLLSNLKHPLPESEVRNRRNRMGIREAVNLLSNLKHPLSEHEVNTRGEARQK